MYHKHLIYLLLLSSLALNAMDDQKNASEISIHEAVYNDDRELVKELLDSGVDVDERAKETKRSIISERIRYNVYDFCEITKWKKGDPPLHIAIKQNHKPIIELLLQHNANVNIKNHAGNSPLHVALNHGNRPMMQLLLEHNASVNVKNCDVWTPFLSAIHDAKVEYVKVFLACGADIDQKYVDYAPLHMEYTPLHIAAKWACFYRRQNLSIEYLYIVKTLLKYNAPVNIKNRDGKKSLNFLLKIDGIKEFYLDNERSQKTAKKIKKVRKIRKRCKRKIVVNKNKY